MNKREFCIFLRSQITLCAWATVLFFTALSASHAAVIDGQVGPGDNYGAALSIQNTDTGFGDAFVGDAVVTGGGSEIDGFYAEVANGRLNIMVTGNLEENFNKLELFFDTRSGGHNTLDGSMLPTGVDGFCCGGLNTTGGALQNMSGMTFDAGIEVDYYITVSHGFETALDDPASPGNPISFWAASAHYSDLTATAPMDRQNVAAGMQLAPNGLPNVLRLDHQTAPKTLLDPPYLPDPLLFGDTDPNHIGPALPNLGQGELVDRGYALGDGQCGDDTGATCIAPELAFALDVAPGDPNNDLSHRRFNNLVDLQMAINNSNFEGVFGDGGGAMTAGNPGDVTTGIELSIPLSELGNPTGDIRVVGFVNGTLHDFASNQFIGEGVLQGNLAAPGGVDLSTVAGDQFVTIANSSPVDGDFDDNGVYDCADIDALVAEIVAGTNDPAFDLNQDTFVNTDDLEQWRVEGGEAILGPGKVILEGDADLNGSVDGGDFIVWNDNKFQTTGAWCSGDFDANGSTDGGDFIIWNDNKFTSSDSVASVPEPTAFTLLGLAALGLITLRRR